MKIYYGTHFSDLQYKVLFETKSGLHWAYVVRKGNLEGSAIHGEATTDGMMVNGMPFSQVKEMSSPRNVIETCIKCNRFNEWNSLKEMYDNIVRSLESMPSKWTSWWSVFNKSDFEDIKQFLLPITLWDNREFLKVLVDEWNVKVKDFEFLQNCQASRHQIVKMKEDAGQFKKGHFYVKCGQYSSKFVILIDKNRIGQAVGVSRIETA